MSEFTVELNTTHFGAAAPLQRLRFATAGVSLKHEEQTGQSQSYFEFHKTPKKDKTNYPRTSYSRRVHNANDNLCHFEILVLGFNRNYLTHSVK
jgi:hypothetical protein